MKQVYKIYIDTGSTFQKECWLRAFADFLEVFKAQMESKHKKNQFIYHKKTVIDHDTIGQSFHDYITSRDAEEFKKEYKEFEARLITIDKLKLENESLKKDVWERDERIKLLANEIRVLTGPRKKRFWLF